MNLPIWNYETARFTDTTHSQPVPEHRGSLVAFICSAIFASPACAHDSLFHGDTLDSIANRIAWVVLYNKANLTLAFLV
jgi:hypothetical protein